MSGNKIKQNCGNISYASCTRYESEVSENSSLDITECISVEEAIEDIYNQLDTVDEILDISSLVGGCITFTEPKTIVSVLTQVCEKLCALEDTVESQAELIETLQSQVADLQANNCP